MLLKTRREMAKFLEDVMSLAYADLAARQRLDVDTTLVKTYLVEAHRLRGADHEKVLSAVRDGFDDGVLGRGTKSRVHETEEELFFNVEVHTGRQVAFLFVDASDTRFWIVHSVSKSLTVDPLIRKLVGSTQEFDFAWLPVQLLEKVAAMGSLRGLGLDYDRRPVPDVDFEEPGSPVQFLKMQLWGNRAGDVLRILRQEEALPDATTLSKVKVKTWLGHSTESPFSVSDVKYDGKITGRGTSFQSYIALVTSLYHSYAEKVEDCERRFLVSFHSDGRNHLSVSGEPLNIFFKEPIRDLTVFCERVFSGSHPFRIWGVPTKTARGHFRVAGIDLHVGRAVNFELSQEYMRVYLTPNSCGNTVIRLFTNLQHYYHSLVEAKDGSEQPVFQF
jgi:hypothetical protein